MSNRAGASSPASRPPTPADEDFVKSLKEELAGDCVIVLLQRWSGASDTGESAVPSYIHTPGPSGELDQASIDAILQAGKESKSVLVPTMFNTPEAEAAAAGLLAQLPGEELCIIAALLMEPGEVLTRALKKILLGKNDQLLALGFDDVILGPETDTPASMRNAIANCRVSWTQLRRRTEQMLQLEPAIQEKEVRALRQRRDKIFFDQIPRTLFPNFPVQDPNLLETQRHIGDFRILRRLPFRCGFFVLAEEEQGEEECVMIKAFDKSSVTDTVALEGIYREQRFMSDAARHPHIAECIGALHGPHRVYLVFSYAGEQTLADFLMDQPGGRLPPEDAIMHFDQCADALEYCHGLSIALRALSLDGILMCRTSLDESLQCKLVSFSAATLAPASAMSKTPFGSLPCMPPEVCLTQEYDPFRADCWSLGVVLLEMAGGLNSLARSIPVDIGEDPPMVGPHLVQFFSSDTSHRRALARIGGVQNAEIEELLQKFLRPDPRERVTMSDIVNGRPSIVREPAEDIPSE